MAVRGARPKPNHLHLIYATRNATRHGSEAELKAKVEAVINDFGVPVRRSYLTGHALKAWNEWIVPARWLDGSKTAAAIAFCEIWKEYRKDPEEFPASKHGQMRAYMQELGLTDERNRKQVENKEKDEFFDD